MADNKFARMMQTARESQTANGEGAQAVAPDMAPARKPRHEASPKTTRGRPATGKRSDPDYESTTVFLRRDTKSAAAKLLIDDRRHDLSDVLETLLSGWIKRQT